MLYDFSVDLATHLYENCQHPKIKGGDFIVAHITGMGIGRDINEAIGLFKIENKETFLTVEHDEEGFDISPVDGVNLRRLDKGALIMNYEREKGYMVAVVDKTNTQGASYWIDDYLHLMRRQDSYFQTQNVMELTRNFVAPSGLIFPDTERDGTDPQLCGSGTPQAVQREPCRSGRPFEPHHGILQEQPQVRYAVI